ncbi:MAG: hypothetical protein AAF317_19775, partial [Pseudomonadota bacterium]
ENFIKAAVDVRALDEKYPDVDVDFDIDDDNPMDALSTLIDDDGQLRLMQRMFTKIADNAPLANDVERIARSSGFDGAMDFARTGDQIIIAAMRSEMSDADLRELSNAEVSPAQLAMIPKEMRGMIEKALLLRDAVENVPASDVALVREYRNELEAVVDDDA